MPRSLSSQYLAYSCSAVRESSMESCVSLCRQWPASCQQVQPGHRRHRCPVLVATPGCRCQGGMRTNSAGRACVDDGGSTGPQCPGSAHVAPRCSGYGSPSSARGPQRCSHNPPDICSNSPSEHNPVWPSSPEACREPHGPALPELHVHALEVGDVVPRHCGVKVTRH
eukprot:scaffold7976_cov403-Prasinococcus_capsulatus_cf.AAC.6